MINSQIAKYKEDFVMQKAKLDKCNDAITAKKNEIAAQGEKIKR